MKPRKQSLVAENRKARHDYHIEESFEAGLVLTGSEVKSLRLGRANLRDGYAAVSNDEVFLHNIHISPYEKAGDLNHEPMRPRKLLLHKSEISKIRAKISEKGYTLVPLKIYFIPSGFAKVEVALAKGKKEYDKRDSIKEREAKRRIDRALKDRD